MFKYETVFLSEDASEEDKKKALEAGGAKWSAGKARFDLIPPESLFALADVCTFGAKKYKDRNWEKGLPWGEFFGATMRHLWSWWLGEKNASDSGLPHLAHAAWNVFALLSYELRGMSSFDDRPNHFKEAA